MTRFECVGPVRGRCGILHRSYEAAERHCAADAAWVAKGHGSNAYSDRRPVPDGDQHKIDGLV